MSAQTMSDVFAPIEAAYRENVMQATWGHLAPRKNKTYLGYVIFAVGCFNPLNPIVLACEFKGLDDSPWFFEALNEFIGKDQSIHRADSDGKERFPVGTVHRFDGKFRNYKFTGDFREVPIS